MFIVGELGILVLFDDGVVGFDGFFDLVYVGIDVVGVVDDGGGDVIVCCI